MEAQPAAPTAHAPQLPRSAPMAVSAPDLTAREGMQGSGQRERDSGEEGSAVEQVRKEGDRYQNFQLLFVSNEQDATVVGGSLFKQSFKSPPRPLIHPPFRVFEPTCGSFSSFHLLDAEWEAVGGSGNGLIHRRLVRQRGGVGDRGPGRLSTRFNVGRMLLISAPRGATFAPDPLVS